MLSSRGHSMIWHKAAFSCPPIVRLRKLFPLVGKTQDICWDKGRGQRKTTPRIDLDHSISPKNEVWLNNHHLPVNLNLLWKSGACNYLKDRTSHVPHYLCEERIWRYLRSSISQFGKWWQTRKPSLAFPFCISNRRKGVFKTEPAKALKHPLITCLVMPERLRSPRKKKKRVLTKFLCLLRVDRKNAKNLKVSGWKEAAKVIYYSPILHCGKDRREEGGRLWK